MPPACAGCLQECDRIAPVGGVNPTLRNAAVVAIAAGAIPLPRAAFDEIEGVPVYYCRDCDRREQRRSFVATLLGIIGSLSFLRIPMALPA